MTNFVRIDRFRIAAAILVVVIHTSPLITYSETADVLLAGILARVAVPFFFMATGFFLYGNGRESSFSFRKFLRKSAMLYGAAVILYLPLSLYAGYFDEKPFLPELIKDIVFNGTFYHLWYFPAVILGAGLVVCLSRYAGLKAAFFAALLLYLIGLGGDSYYGIVSQVPLIKGFYHILFQCFDYTRNGLFFAPIYLVLGILASKQKPLSRTRCILGLSVSLPVMAAEGLVLHLCSQPRHDSMYLSLIFVMYFLFSLLLLPGNAAMTDSLKAKVYGRNLRRMSLIIYLIHPWCIVLIRGAAGLIGAQEIIVHNSLVFFFAVTASSALAAAMANVLLRKVKIKWGISYIRN